MQNFSKLHEVLGIEHWSPISAIEHKKGCNIKISQFKNIHGWYVYIFKLFFINIIYIFKLESNLF
jgi:hypothetical protein